ncbi:hypothetical protein A1OE_1232 [Candidatus Endolissoclinum faulkneri L2]|uniref:Uncharacterized protein n=1 Tax=Candidatus Endolissoclinum faulkneri L2 TaxID=1193729 RepID=K7YPF9_9PROT|nr:hypothetical protein A1OE_1232 [Candidatus Endolissoclinum faulkneri L2]
MSLIYRFLAIYYMYPRNNVFILHLIIFALIIIFRFLLRNFNQLFHNIL